MNTNLTADFGMLQMNSEPTRPPIVGVLYTRLLIFLRYANHKFTQIEQEISSESATSRRIRV